MWKIRLKDRIIDFIKDFSDCDLTSAELAVTSVEKSEKKSLENFNQTTTGYSTSNRGYYGGLSNSKSNWLDGSGRKYREHKKQNELKLENERVEYERQLEIQREKEYNDWLLDDWLFDDDDDDDDEKRRECEQNNHFCNCNTLP